VHKASTTAKRGMEEWLLRGSGESNEVVEVVLQEQVIQSLWAGFGVLTRYVTTCRQVVVKQVGMDMIHADQSVGTLRKLR